MSDPCFRQAAIIEESSQILSQGIFTLKDMKKENQLVGSCGDGDGAKILVRNVIFIVSDGVLRVQLIT